MRIRSYTFQSKFVIFKQHFVTNKANIRRKFIQFFCLQGKWEICVSEEHNMILNFKELYQFKQEILLKLLYLKRHAFGKYFSHFIGALKHENHFAFIIFSHTSSTCIHIVPESLKYKLGCSFQNTIYYYTKLDLLSNLWNVKYVYILVWYGLRSFLIIINHKKYFCFDVQVSSCPNFGLQTAGGVVQNNKTRRTRCMIKANITLYDQKAYIEH